MNNPLHKSLPLHPQKKMKDNMQPERSCIVCRKRYGQNQLTRIAKDKDAVIIQQGKKIAGRGAYVCKTRECVEKAVKSKALNRVFKCNVGAEIYEGLLKQVTIDREVKSNK